MNRKHAIASTPDIITAPKDLLGFKIQNDPFKETTFNPLIHELYALQPQQAFCLESGACAVGVAGATLETRKGGGRVVLLGSYQLATESVLRWIRGEEGKVKIVSFTHELSDSTLPKNRGISELSSTIYRINDFITITLCLEGK